MSLALTSIQERGQDVHGTFLFDALSINNPCFCVSSCFEKSSHTIQIDDIVIPTNINISDSNENVSKLIKSIDVKFWEKRESWLQIAYAMKNIGCTFSEFDKYSQSAPNYGGTRKLWDSLRLCSSGNSIGTLYYYASQSSNFKSDNICLLSNTQQECIKSIIRF